MIHYNCNCYPINLVFFAKSNYIYDIADDITVKNGDDYRLLGEDDLKILTKEQFADTRKSFEKFPNAEIVGRDINEDCVSPYCIYSFAGVN